MVDAASSALLMVPDGQWWLFCFSLRPERLLWPIMAKLNVNGSDADPLSRFLFKGTSNPPPGGDWVLWEGKGGIFSPRNAAAPPPSSAPCPKMPIVREKVGLLVPKPEPSPDGGAALSYGQPLHGTHGTPWPSPSGGCSQEACPRGST